ncbi:MAG: zinc-ribbon domain-containing protein [Anaerolineaceae bacterium]|jgi:ribosomal protein L40E|nr:zinc-ribbon domain-containing protein [Anaerolineaceae bacterium]NLE93747.1 zinc-ribbon domain-containing protein [Chloroflexota bacterium]
MIICKKCEHDNPDPARFCEKCGESFAGVKAETWGV